MDSLNLNKHQQNDPNYVENSKELIKYKHKKQRDHYIKSWDTIILKPHAPTNLKLFGFSFCIAL